MVTLYVTTYRVTQKISQFKIIQVDQKFGTITLNFIKSYF